MNPFRRTTDDTTTATDTTRHPNPDLPDGYDDEASPFYVPAELRDHYAIDHDAEAVAWNTRARYFTDNPLAKFLLDDGADYPERAAAAKWFYRRDVITDDAAWQRHLSDAVTQWGAGGLARTALAEAADRDPAATRAAVTGPITDTRYGEYLRIAAARRGEWFHAKRLGAAAEAHRLDEARTATLTALAHAHVCDACGLDHPSTHLRDVWSNGQTERVTVHTPVPQTDGETPRRLKLCTPCTTAMEYDLARQTVETLLPDGRTHLDAARDLWRREQ